MRTTISAPRLAQYVIGTSIWLYVFCHDNVWAHSAAGLESIDVVKPMSSERLGLETTVGYLRSSDSDQFEWFCHEAVTQPDALLTPRYSENSAGFIVAAMTDLKQARDAEVGLYWSADGCDWAAAGGVDGQQVNDVELSPISDSSGVLVSDSDDGLGGIFRTEDGGETWIPTAIQHADRSFRSVRHARGSAGSVWVAAVQQEAKQAWAYRSVDNGKSWTEHPVPVPEGSDPFTYFDVVAVDHHNPDIAWFVMGPYLDDRLLQTMDGGETFNEVYSVDRDIIDAALDKEGGLWLVLSGNTMVHGTAEGAFSEAEGAPTSLGVETDNEDVILATRVLAENGPIAFSSDGLEFTVYDAFAALQSSEECPPDSHYGVYCAPLWPDLERKLVGITGDTGSVDTPTNESETDPVETGSKSSGCSQSAPHRSAHLMMVLLVVGLVSRIRKP